MDADDAKKQDALVHAAKTLCSPEHRTGIILSGRVVNGKVELDKASLDEIGRKFAGANKSFIAVNAPFDPGPSLG